jgi:transposase-like protein
MAVGGILPDPVVWLSVTAYAHAYGVSRTTVYKWLQLGRLGTFQTSYCRRIRNSPPTETPPVSKESVKPSRPPAQHLRTAPKAKHK